MGGNLRAEAYTLIRCGVTYTLYLSPALLFEALSVPRRRYLIWYLFHPHILPACKDAEVAGL